MKDGRTITVPLAWYPKLFNASPDQRKNWRISGGGYGIHWADLDEDLSTEGLLRGAPAPAPKRLSGGTGRYRPHASHDLQALNSSLLPRGVYGGLTGARGADFFSRLPAPPPEPPASGSVPASRRTPRAPPAFPWCSRSRPAGRT